MAATRLIPLHVNQGKTAAASLKDRLDYAENPEKTEGGTLVESYECDPHLAWQEWMLERGNYINSHRSERRSDVIAYQIRQSFKPGEICPEEANRIGCELAKRFTKGKHAFVVSTHTDRAHVHNHILFNAIDLDGEKKFHNFFLSAYAVRRLSDTICVEHGISIIEEKGKRTVGRICRSPEPEKGCIQRIPDCQKGNAAIHHCPEKCRDVIRKRKRSGTERAAITRSVMI